jgi:uncharacterized membrane protein
VILSTKEKILHVFFDIGVIAKAADGALEVAGGFLLLLMPPDRIYSVIRILTQHELSEDPKDAIATHILNSALQLTPSTKTFAAIYLLWHGAVKVVLVLGLLFRRRWAYPFAIAAFFLFVLYQLYRYLHTYSLTLVILSVLDIVVIALTWLEYRRLQRTGGFERSAH